MADDTPIEELSIAITLDDETEKQFEEISKAIEEFSKDVISNFDEINKSIESFSKEIEDGIIAPFKDAAKEIERYITDINDALGDLEISKIGDEIDKELVEPFKNAAKEISDVIDDINQSLKDLQLSDLSNEIEDSLVTPFKNAADEINNTINEINQSLQNINVSSLSSSLESELVAPFQSASDQISSLISNLQSEINGLDLSSGLADSLESSLTDSIESVRTSITSLQDDMDGLSETITKSFSDMDFTSLGENLAESIVSPIKTAVEEVQSMLDGLSVTGSTGSNEIIVSGGDSGSSSDAFDNLLSVNERMATTLEDMLTFMQQQVTDQQDQQDEQDPYESTPSYNPSSYTPTLFGTQSPNFANAPEMTIGNQDITAAARLYSAQLWGQTTGQFNQWASGGTQSAIDVQKQMGIVSKYLTGSGKDVTTFLNDLRAVTGGILSDQQLLNAAKSQLITGATPDETLQRMGIARSVQQNMGGDFETYANTLKNVMAYPTFSRRLVQLGINKDETETAANQIMNQLGYKPTKGKGKGLDVESTRADLQKINKFTNFMSQEGISSLDTVQEIYDSLGKAGFKTANAVQAAIADFSKAKTTGKFLGEGAKIKSLVADFKTNYGLDQSESIAALNMFMSSDMKKLNNKSTEMFDLYAQYGTNYSGQSDTGETGTYKDLPDAQKTEVMKKALLQVLTNKYGSGTTPLSGKSSPSDLTKMAGVQAEEFQKDVGAGMIPTLNFMNEMQIQMYKSLNAIPEAMRGIAGTLSSILMNISNYFTQFLGFAGQTSFLLNELGKAMPSGVGDFLKSSVMDSVKRTGADKFFSNLPGIKGFMSEESVFDPSQLLLRSTTKGKAGYDVADFLHMDSAKKNELMSLQGLSGISIDNIDDWVTLQKQTLLSKGGSTADLLKQKTAWQTQNAGALLSMAPEQAEQLWKRQMVLGDLGGASKESRLADALKGQSKATLKDDFDAWSDENKDLISKRSGSEQSSLWEDMILNTDRFGGLKEAALADLDTKKLSGFLGKTRSLLGVGAMTGARYDDELGSLAKVPLLGSLTGGIKDLVGILKKDKGTTKAITEEAAPLAKALAGLPLIGSLIPALSGLGGGVGLAGIATTLGTIAGAATGIGLVAAALFTLYEVATKGWENSTLYKFIKVITDSVPQLNSVWNVLSDIGKILVSVGTGIAETLGKVGSIISSSFINSIMTSFQHLSDAINNMLKPIFGDGSGGGLFEMAKKAWEDFVGALDSAGILPVINAIGKAIAELAGFMLSLPLKALIEGFTLLVNTIKFVADGIVMIGKAVANSPIGQFVEMLASVAASGIVKTFEAVAKVIGDITTAINDFLKSSGIGQMLELAAKVLGIGTSSSSSGTTSKTTKPKVDLSDILGGTAVSTKADVNELLGTPSSLTGADSLTGSIPDTGATGGVGLSAAVSSYFQSKATIDAATAQAAADKIKNATAIPLDKNTSQLTNNTKSLLDLKTSVDEQTGLLTTGVGSQVSATKDNTEASNKITMSLSAFATKQSGATAAGSTSSGTFDYAEELKKNTLASGAIDYSDLQKKMEGSLLPGVSGGNLFASVEDANLRKVKEWTGKSDDELKKQLGAADYSKLSTGDTDVLNKLLANDSSAKAKADESRSWQDSFQKAMDDQKDLNKKTGDFLTLGLNTMFPQNTAASAWFNSLSGVSNADKYKDANDVTKSDVVKSEANVYQNLAKLKELYSNYGSATDDTARKELTTQIGQLATTIRETTSQGKSQEDKSIDKYMAQMQEMVKEAVGMNKGLLTQIPSTDLLSASLM